MNEDKVIVSLTRAKKILVKGKTVHTFISFGQILMGADMKKKDVIELIKTNGAELAGPNMTNVDHGLATKNTKGEYLFLETKPEWSKVL